MKFNIGDPIRKKKSKWKGYIAKIHPNEVYLISCEGYKTYSHCGLANGGDLELRKMPKREIPIQQAFRREMEKLAVDIPKRLHSCKGCPMMPKEIKARYDHKPYNLARSCGVFGIRYTIHDPYPFRKTRCLVRPRSGRMKDVFPLEEAVRRHVIRARKQKEQTK